MESPRSHSWFAWLFHTSNNGDVCSHAASTCFSIFSMDTVRRCVSIWIVFFMCINCFSMPAIGKLNNMDISRMPWINNSFWLQSPDPFYLPSTCSLTSDFTVLGKLLKRSSIAFNSIEMFMCFVFEWYSPKFSIRNKFGSPRNCYEFYLQILEFRSATTHTNWHCMNIWPRPTMRIKYQIVKTNETKRKKMDIVLGKGKMVLHELKTNMWMKSKMHWINAVRRFFEAYNYPC